MKLLMEFLQFLSKWFTYIFLERRGRSKRRPRSFLSLPYFTACYEFQPAQCKKIANRFSRQERVCIYEKFKSTKKLKDNCESVWILYMKFWWMNPLLNFSSLGAEWNLISSSNFGENDVSPEKTLPACMTSLPSRVSWIPKKKEKKKK